MLEGTTHIPGITALAAILIAAFLIDRAVCGLLFLLSFSESWTRRFPDPALIADPAEHAKSERNRKATYFAMGIALSLALAFFAGIRIFGPLGFARINPFFDKLLTAFTLTAASDRFADILKLAAGKAPEEAGRPVELKGTLVIRDDGTASSALAAHAGEQRK